MNKQTPSLLFIDLGKAKESSRYHSMKRSSNLFKYLRIFPITIIKSKYRFHFALWLGVTIVLSVLLVVYGSNANINVNAQHSLESINRLEQLLAESPQIMIDN